MLPSEVGGLPLFEFFVLLNFVTLGLIIVYFIVSAIRKDKFHSDAIDAIKYLVVAYREKGNLKQRKKAIPSLPNKISIKSSYPVSKSAQKLVNMVEQLVGEAY